MTYTFYGGNDDFQIKTRNLKSKLREITINKNHLSQKIQKTIVRLTSFAKYQLGTGMCSANSSIIDRKYHTVQNVFSTYELVTMRLKTQQAAQQLRNSFVFVCDRYLDGI